MVRYLDPEEHPELGECSEKARRSPAERLTLIRERNAALVGAEAVEAAREVALRLLDTRSRSTGELRTAITSKGFNEAIAEEVLERLTRVGLIDDDAFARALVADRFHGSGRVGRALTEEMARKGLDAETIARALDAVDPDDELERARELVERKMRSMNAVSRDAAYRRLAGMLARKGYSPSLANAVISAALNGRDDDSAPTPPGGRGL